MQQGGFIVNRLDPPAIREKMDARRPESSSPFDAMRKIRHALTLTLCPEGRHVVGLKLANLPTRAMERKSGNHQNTRAKSRSRTGAPADP
jgi:hypothetical protein